MGFNHSEKLRQRETMATCPRYQGKVVIVVVGTSDTGRAIVREFVRQGARVVFGSPPCEAEKGQAIQRELQDSGSPGEACCQVCDVRKEADIQNLILSAVKHYGCLDCLVNNSEVVGPVGSIDDMTSEDFCTVMEINLLSYFLASKYALPFLRETRGNIINMARLFALIGHKDAPPFVTSKGGVIAMTKALAIDESKCGVRVNSVAQGHVWSDLWKSYADQYPNPEKVIQDGKNSQLMGRFGTPEEVASAVLFLAADGTFCTGTNLVMSGGADLGFAKKNQVDTEADPRKCWSSRDSPRLGRRLGVAKGPGYAWRRPSMVSPPGPSPSWGPSCSHIRGGGWPCAPSHQWPAWSCHPRSHPAWSRHTSS